MAKEIIQPSIPRPDLREPLAWATVSRTHCEWLRYMALQLGLDERKLILGDVLSSIIGNDASSFGMLYLPELGHDAKASILERMNWEISVPETPRQIKTKLKEVTKKICNLNFTDEQEYRQAKQAWLEVKNWVEQESRHKREWRVALDYDLEIAGVLSPYWQQFLYGKITY